jgi:hypothetical protein
VDSRGRLMKELISATLWGALGAVIVVVPLFVLETLIDIVKIWRSDD